MLDRGVRAALGRHGIRTDVLAFAERESAAAATLLARMEEKRLEPAPIWIGDLESLPGERFHGLVDGIVAGFPCQPHSVAGKKLGRDDERNLLPAILTQADRTGASFLFLENVAGLKREFDYIAALLLQSGWNLEWGTLRASDVGASHRRERWFCVAYRARITGGGQDKFRDLVSASSGYRAAYDCRESILASGAGAGRRTVDAEWRAEWRGTPGREGAIVLADSKSLDRRIQLQPGRQNEASSEFGGSGGTMGDTDRIGQQQPHDAGSADAWSGARNGAGGAGVRLPAFAPGPKDARWAGILARFPFLAPSLPVSPVALRNAWGRILGGSEMEAIADFHSVADGLGDLVESSRVDMLRLAGNGVVWQQAACAFHQLFARTLTP